MRYISIYSWWLIVVLGLVFAFVPCILSFASIFWLTCFSLLCAWSVLGVG